MPATLRRLVPTGRTLGEALEAADSVEARRDVLLGGWQAIIVGPGRLLWAPAERRAIKAALEPATRAPRSRAGSGLCSGLLHCGGCGRRMHKVGDRYACSSYAAAAKRENRSCPAPAVARVALVDGFVEAAFLESLGEHAETTVVFPADDHRDRVAGLEDERDALLATMTTASAAGRREILADVERLEEDIAALSAAVPASALGVVTPTGRTIAEAWHAGGADERRHLVASAWSAVEVAKGKGRIGERLTFVD